MREFVVVTAWIENMYKWPIRCRRRKVIVGADVRYRGDNPVVRRPLLFNIYVIRKRVGPVCRERYAKTRILKIF